MLWRFSFRWFSSVGSPINVCQQPKVKNMFLELQLTIGFRAFDILFGVLNPFLGERIKNNVRFCGHNMDKLQEELPPQVLPEHLNGRGDEKDYNVSMEAVKDLEQKLKNNLQKTEELSKIFKK